MAEIKIQKQVRIPGLIVDRAARKRFEQMALNKIADWVKKVATRVSIGRPIRDPCRTLWYRPEPRGH
jgi:hypothetical protein